MTMFRIQGGKFTIVWERKERAKHPKLPFSNNLMCLGAPYHNLFVPVLMAGRMVWRKVNFVVVGVKRSRKVCKSSTGNITKSWMWTREEKQDLPSWHFQPGVAAVVTTLQSVTVAPPFLYIRNKRRTTKVPERGGRVQSMPFEEEWCTLEESLPSCNRLHLEIAFSVLRKCHHD